MAQSLIVGICLIVLVCAKASDSDSESQESSCSRFCHGDEYECVDGQCYCAQGYVPDYFYNRCVKCPGLAQKCYGTCCSEPDEPVLTCWQGSCKVCTDANNNWICRETLDNIFLVSSTQVAMATALILGIVATFILLYKLCTVTNLGPYGRRGTGGDSRLSVGSLQLYVDERLRDAPPRYSTAPPNSAGIPATVFLNPAFIHDSSHPPPPYTPKEENPPQNNAVHM